MTLGRRCLVTIWLLGLLLLSSCSQDRALPSTINLDFPHSELRLLVQRDDDALLFYGAHPMSREVPQGVFDIDVVLDQLQGRLREVVPSEDRPPGRSYGLVTIDFDNGASMDYLIYDGAYASVLFMKSCSNRVRQEDSATEIFERSCASVLEGVP